MQLKMWNTYAGKNQRRKKISVTGRSLCLKLKHQSKFLTKRREIFSLKNYRLWNFAQNTDVR